jgi:hypothetical protein
MPISPPLPNVSPQLVLHRTLEYSATALAKPDACLAGHLIEPVTSPTFGPPLNIAPPCAAFDVCPRDTHAPSVRR